jgi:hypothetical protein
MVTMSQKSSLLQVASSVSLALTPDKRVLGLKVEISLPQMLTDCGVPIDAWQLP